LTETSRRMAASRTVPMGEHDIEMLSSLEAIQAFASFVAAEQELLALLRGRVEEHGEMLTEMRGAG